MIRHLLSREEAALWLQLVEERVVLPLLLRLDQEVDAGGGGPTRSRRHLKVKILNLLGQKQKLDETFFQLFLPRSN